MTMKARYTVIDGEVIAEKRGGVRSLYVPDPLGSTVALLDNTQAQTDTISYWPYGENDVRTGGTATPFQFVGTDGYYRDGSNRTYVRARTLDTQQGRWLSRDPIGFALQDWNLYRYVSNAPISFSDPLGLSPYPCIGEILAICKSYCGEWGIKSCTMNTDYVDPTTGFCAFDCQCIPHDCARDLALCTADAGSDQAKCMSSAGAAAAACYAGCDSLDGAKKAACKSVCAAGLAGLVALCSNAYKDRMRYCYRRYDRCKSRWEGPKNKIPYIPIRRPTR